MTISIIGNLFTNKRMRIKLPHIAQTLYTEALAEFGGVLIGQVLQQNHTVRDAMCSAVCTCPTAVRLWQSYFALRMGQSPSVLTEVADLIGGLHFELVHGLLGLGDAPRLLEELLLLIIKLSFSVREASLPEGWFRLTWACFVPQMERYEWRVAAVLEKCTKRRMAVCGSCEYHSGCRQECW